MLDFSEPHSIKELKVKVLILHNGLLQINRLCIILLDYNNGCMKILITFMMVLFLVSLDTDINKFPQYNLIICKQTTVIS